MGEREREVDPEKQRWTDTQKRDREKKRDKEIDKEGGGKGKEGKGKASDDQMEACVQNMVTRVVVVVLIHCVNKLSFCSRAKNNFHSMSRPHVHHDTLGDNDRCL